MIDQPKSQQEISNLNIKYDNITVTKDTVL